MAITLPLRADANQPKSYWLSQPYHNGGMWYNPYPHHALDMIGYYRQPVYAAQSGKVFAASWNGVPPNQSGWAYGGGFTVLIDHNAIGRYGKTAYAHLAQISVAAGQYVVQGQLIGYSDSTGNSTGHHLHFSVGVCIAGANPYYYNSWKWMDPRSFMRAHTYANGSVGNGVHVNHFVLRNTFTVNSGANLRADRWLSSAIVRQTTTRTKTVFISRVSGSNWNGSSYWYRVYDPVSRRVVTVHSTLGVLS